MNSLKSLFRKTGAAGSSSGGRSAEANPFSPGPASPRYAYGFQSPYRQPRILILVDNVRATYFLSFHYALKRLHETESLAFFVIDSAEIGRWTQGKSPEAFVNQVIEDVQPTLVIFSRYGVPHGDVLPGLFKAQQISTVCHIDDDLLNINTDLGEEIQTRQGDPVVLRSRRILLEETDLIYASTAFLADHFSTQFPEQNVFHGTYPPYPDFLLEAAPKPKPEGAPLTIGYMGSKGHQIDLQAIAPALQQVLTAYPTLRFETFGTIRMPETLNSFSDRIRAHKNNTDYAGFLNQLNRLAWDIGLIPLQDTRFNQCRSATKFLEYTTCGISALASRGYVYDQFAQASEPQIMIAEVDTWTTQLEAMIESRQLRQTLVRNAQTHCAEAFNLNALEAQLKEMLALV
ncbi:MAG: hypothetical protein AB8B99_05045 [Phormidesmis sp.]